MKTGTLAIGLKKVGLDADIDKAVMAEITRVTTGGGATPKTPFHKVLAVPAGGSRKANIALKPGGYVVTLTPPGGEAVSQDCWISGGDRKEIEFDIGRSRREWLAFQTLTGATPLNAQREEELRVVERPHYRFSAKAEGAPQLLTFTFKRANAPGASRAGDWTGGFQGDWTPGGALGASNFDSMHAVWRLPAKSFSHMPDAHSQDDITLAAIQVVTPDGIARALVPAPWRINYDRHADFEVLYDAGREAERNPLSVSVHDETSVALMSYLRTGQLGQAHQALEEATLEATINNRIRDKFQNPLLAAAATYVALATPGARLKRETWRPWVRNLCNKFAWMSDGAILEARLLLNEHGVTDKVVQAADRAFDRGPPFFSAGLPHLMSVLYRCQAKHPDLRARYETVSRYSAAIDPLEPFCVQWLPREGPLMLETAPLLMTR